MQPDLGQHAANEHADLAKTMLESAEASLADNPDEVSLKIALAQAHATLALALETRAAAYDTRTAAYVTYLATLIRDGRSDKQHLAVVEKLVRGRLGFEPS
jgi:hypothetical protein